MSPYSGPGHQHLHLLSLGHEGHSRHPRPRQASRERSAAETVLSTDLLDGPPTAQLASHCIEISIYVFLEKELRGLSPNFQIHVSSSDQYTPMIGPPIFLQQNRQTDCGNI